ncbi:YybH family protein [Alicycliphilus denitrificans]|uniref:YybH family protein n=1 Tax=Alicycliphilus denitrificans TaxID=179636 RepID=UPI00384A52E7
MTRSSLRAVLAGSPDELEAAFYAALQQGDIERVMACWADEDEIVCVHPGGARLLGPVAIRAAYTAMLERGGLQVRPAQEVRVQALASSVHSVQEQVRIVLPDGVRETVVQATNVYHKTPKGWRLVAHHASAAEMRDTPAPTPAAHMLH